MKRIYCQTCLFVALLVVLVGHVRADVFVQVTDVSQLCEGMEIVIVPVSNNKMLYPLGTSTTENVLPVVTNNTFEDPNNWIRYTIVRTTPNFRFQNKAVPTNYISMPVGDVLMSVWNIIPVPSTTLFQLKVSGMNTLLKTQGVTRFYIFKCLSMFDAGHYGHLTVENPLYPNSTGIVVAPSCISNNEESYPFLGWATTPDATAPDVLAGDSIIPCAPIYYAVYRTMFNQCFDFTDLFAPNVIFYVNNQQEDVSRSIGDPTILETQISVIEEYASDPHNLPTASPFAAYDLSQVPVGHDKSVRLGNYCRGGTTAAIRYSFTVDTAYNPILLLRLAFVLQRPDHDGGPGISIALLDSSYNSSPCLGMSAQLDPNGFNGYRLPGNPAWYGKDYLYMDWPAIGFDLSPYHGQEVALNCTAHDCDEVYHIGYTYYTVECVPRKIEVVESCSGEATMTAPEGFFYRWYRENAPTTILSSERTITVENTDGTFVCECTNNPDFDCSFTLSVDVSKYITISDTTWAEATICAGESYEWDGQSYNQEGTYIKKYTNIQGCDSVVGLRLSFYPPIDTTWTEATICAGESYVWENDTYQQEGVYKKIYTRLDGCDSVAVLRLHVKGAYYANPEFWDDPFMPKVEHDTICEGDAKWWHGKWIETSGFFTDTLQSVYGCDSVVYLQLEQKVCPKDPCIIQPITLPIRVFEE